MMTNHITFYQFCSAVRRKGALALCLALCVLGLGLSGSAQKPRMITFDVTPTPPDPPPGTEAGQGTIPQAINPAGAITGYYFDASNVSHGFLRARDSRFTTFDAPGAGTGAYQGTYAYSINPAGATTGGYTDASDVNHGFLRTPDDTITPFDVTTPTPPDPLPGTEAGQGTIGANINPAGEISGWYIDASGVWHGFLRAPDGKFTTFDAPGANTNPGYGTAPGDVQCLNPAGATTGGYEDAHGREHAFIRAPDGRFTEYEAPGASTSPYQGTFFGSINPAGAVSGFYWDTSNVFHALLRDPDGRITKFDVRGAGTGAGQGTIPYCNNPAGAITGWYVDASGVSHGFLRPAGPPWIW